MIDGSAVYRFEIMTQFPRIISGVSTREFGPIKKHRQIQWENANHFFEAVAIPDDRAVFMHQVHSGNVAVVSDAAVREIDSVDSLVTATQDLFLCVVTADCLPVVMYDPKQQVVAAVHAGYKGLLHNVLTHTVEKLEDLCGSLPEDIVVGIGPHIRKCCYTVEYERIMQFLEAFPQYSKIYEKRDDTYILDLTSIALQQLLEAGIKKEHSEDMNICTKDMLSEFYSYRAESAEAYGEFVTTIGML